MKNRSIPLDVSDFTLLNQTMIMWPCFHFCIQVLAEDEKDSAERLEDEDLDRALSVERFGDIITESGTNGADKMGRSYNEKDFECEYSCLWTAIENTPGVFQSRKYRQEFCAMLHS